MTSFRARLTVRWTASFGLLLALANVAVYVGTRAFALRDLDAQVRTLAGTELTSVVDEWRGPHVHEFPVEALGRREWADKVVQVLDAHGQVIAQTSTLPGAAMLAAPGVLAEALAGEAPISTVAVGGRKARATVIGFRHGGVPGALLVGLYTDRLDASLAHLAWLLAGVWLAGLVLTATIGYVLASHALAPVDRITARAAAIARGDVGGRLDPPLADDEIGRMTALLNEMLDRLHAVIDANRRFAADASHELRSPLTAIAGEVDVALKRERTAAEYRDTLRVVRARLDELMELADGLTVLVRAEEAGRAELLEEVPLAPLVAEACAASAGTASARGITIATEGLDGLVAYADRRLLARAVDNLVANAVHYDRDGGRVTIGGELDEPATGSWEPGRIRLRVTDTGPGIPEPEWERVFERFSRLESSRSRRTGGSGLGLAIARAALSLCGGTVRVVASSPAGTTMELCVPGCRDAAGAEAAAGAPEPR